MSSHKLRLTNRSKIESQTSVEPLAPAGSERLNAVCSFPELRSPSKYESANALPDFCQHSAVQIQDARSEPAKWKRRSVQKHSVSGKEKRPNVFSKGNAWQFRSGKWRQPCNRYDLLGRSEWKPPDSA